MNVFNSLLDDCHLHLLINIYNYFFEFSLIAARESIDLMTFPRYTLKISVNNWIWLLDRSRRTARKTDLTFKRFIVYSFDGFVRSSCAQGHGVTRRLAV